jgi:ribosomal protein L37AE/L43A
MSPSSGNSRSSKSIIVRAERRYGVRSALRSKSRNNAVITALARRTACPPSRSRRAKASSSSVWQFSCLISFRVSLHQARSSAQFGRFAIRSTKPWMAPGMSFASGYPAGSDAPAPRMNPILIGPATTQPPHREATRYQPSTCRAGSSISGFAECVSISVSARFRSATPPGGPASVPARSGSCDARGRG